MSKKIRCGMIGIDLNQIWFWKLIPSTQGDSLQKGVEFLKLYSSNDTITIRKILPEGATYINDEIISLAEKDFNKLLECLDEEFSCNLSEESSLLAQVYGK